MAHFLKTKFNVKIELHFLFKYLPRQFAGNEVELLFLVTLTLSLSATDTTRCQIFRNSTVWTSSTDFKSTAMITGTVILYNFFCFI